MFEILKKHKLRLNIAKCTFGVSSKKILGHLVTRRGNEANLEQIMGILDLESLRTTNEVKNLTSMTKTLNCFISKSFNKCRHFFNSFAKIPSFYEETSASLCSISSKSILPSHYFS